MTDLRTTFKRAGLIKIRDNGSRNKPMLMGNTHSIRSQEVDVGGKTLDPPPPLQLFRQPETVLSSEPHRRADLYTTRHEMRITGVFCHGGSQAWMASGTKCMPDPSQPNCTWSAWRTTDTHHINRTEHAPHPARTNWRSNQPTGPVKHLRVRAIHPRRVSAYRQAGR